MDPQAHFDGYAQHVRGLHNARRQEDAANNGIVSEELRARREFEDINNAAILFSSTTGYYPKLPQALLANLQVQNIAPASPLLQPDASPTQKTVLLKDVDEKEKITEFKGEFFVMRCPLCWILPPDKQPRTFTKGPMTSVASMYAHLNQSSDKAHGDLLGSEKTLARAAFVAGLLVTDATEGSVAGHNAHRETLGGLVSEILPS